MIKNVFEGKKSWFTKARFGVFFHFGLYTLLKGNENQVRKGWSRKKYAGLMKKFNPQKFNADEWVKLAKDNGAKYIVPTTKHGEGFCLWDTKVTKYKITNTPFKRDIIAELAKACRRHKIKLCLYYSMHDWLEDNHDDPDTYPEFFEAQIRELMTQYGEIGMVWFDGATPGMPRKEMKKIVTLIRQLQPGAVINDRGLPLDQNHLGDFVTPERFIPRPVLSDNHPFIECCDAMGRNSWGYDENGYFWSAPELIRRLSEVASIGGNYLLNVEPAPDGSVRPECVERMEKIGSWLKTNNDAVYNVESCLLKPIDPTLGYPEIGVSTQNGKTIYLHLHQWPKSDVVQILNCVGEVKNAEIIGLKNYRLKIDSSIGKREPEILITNLPSVPTSLDVPVLKLDFKKIPMIQKQKIIQSYRKTVPVLPGETVYLMPEQAERWSPDAIPRQRINHYPNGAVTIGGFALALKSKTIWRLNVEKAGKYELLADLGTAPSQANTKFSITVARQILSAVNKETGCYEIPERMKIGTVKLPVGKHKLVLQILESSYSFSDIHAIVLIPY